VLTSPTHLRYARRPSPDGYAWGSGEAAIHSLGEGAVLGGGARDFGRLSFPGEKLGDMLAGRVVGDAGHYVSDILEHPRSYAARGPPAPCYRQP
jgi:hypothetical protein